ncbi:PcfK-like protein [Fodinibius roseus]|uniref:PcfK-like protein n=1 Tax=Fodinibius roseus TaxID=1194090 RepID=A0A1M5KM57_9BACT|nr:Cas9 inhibitor AcrIIA9 family protein [Fodinibius roseus]SHG53796.1 PcfK-like protein [Fodinibius roseus]
MKKGTDHFKATIQTHLEEKASDDPLFAEKLNKEDKDIDGCINYIIHQVKKIGAQGYTDKEIYGMAAHYYRKDDLDECDPIDCGVVVDHKPKLTQEEKQELKEQVRREEIEKERKRLHSGGKRKRRRKKEQEEEQTNLF